MADVAPQNLGFVKSTIREVCVDGTVAGHIGRAWYYPDSNHKEDMKWRNTLLNLLSIVQSSSSFSAENWSGKVKP